MINRNKELEKKLMDLLEESSKTANNEGCAILVNAVIALYKATSEKEYADCYAAIHSYRNVSVLF